MEGRRQFGAGVWEERAWPRDWEEWAKALGWEEQGEEQGEGFHG